MPGRERVTLLLSAVAAVVCLATGVAYSLHGGGVPPVGLWLGSLALLGASGLGASGRWQERAEGTPRLIALLLLAGLAAGSLASNAFALVLAGEAHLAPPRALHWAGLVVGGALYIDALAEASRSFARHRGNATRAG